MGARRANSGPGRTTSERRSGTAGCRAFYVFQLVLPGRSAGLSASQVAWVTGGEDILVPGGVGTLDPFFLGWAVASIPAGILIDRGNPGRWLVLSVSHPQRCSSHRWTHAHPHLAGPVFPCASCTARGDRAIQPSIRIRRGDFGSRNMVGATDIVRNFAVMPSVAANPGAQVLLPLRIQMTARPQCCSAVAGGVLLVLQRAQRPVESSGRHDRLSAPDQTGMAGVIQRRLEDPGLRSAAIAAASDDHGHDAHFPGGPARFLICPHAQCGPWQSGVLGTSR